MPMPSEGHTWGSAFVRHTAQPAPPPRIQLKRRYGGLPDATLQPRWGFAPQRPRGVVAWGVEGRGNVYFATSSSPRPPVLKMGWMWCMYAATLCGLCDRTFAIPSGKHLQRHDPFTGQPTLAPGPEREFAGAQRRSREVAD